MLSEGILEKYGEYIELPECVVPLSLCEGNTPLIPVPKIVEGLGGGFERWVKVPKRLFVLRLVIPPLQPLRMPHERAWRQLCSFPKARWLAANWLPLRSM